MLLRSFIAIQMPTAIQDEIEKSTAHLKKALTRPLVRWIHPHNVHLTLKFLGDVSAANLELLAHALKRESEQHAGFSLSIGGLGIFPNSRRPRGGRARWWNAMHGAASESWFRSWALSARAPTGFLRTYSIPDRCCQAPRAARAATTFRSACRWTSGRSSAPHFC